MAKRFIFELESALRLKTYAVQQSKDHLAQIIEQINDVNSSISELQNEVTILQESNTQLGKQSADSLFHQWQYQTSIIQKITTFEKKLIQLNEIASVRQKALIIATQDEKIFLQLKEKKILAHKIHLDKEEQNFLDEIGQQIAIRNKQTKI